MVSDDVLPSTEKVSRKGKVLINAFDCIKFDILSIFSQNVFISGLVLPPAFISSLALRVVFKAKFHLNHQNFQGLSYIVPYN